MAVSADDWLRSTWNARLNRGTATPSPAEQPLPDVKHPTFGVTNEDGTYGRQDVPQSWRGPVRDDRFPGGRADPNAGFRQLLDDLQYGTGEHLDQMRGGQ